VRRLVVAVSLAFFGIGNARAADYGDPQGSGVIVGAVDWLQGTLMGTVATTAAVIAVAVVGFMMLTGRVNWRHGAMVILGCFVLFGAASIVAGIRATAGGFKNGLRRIAQVLEL
jgi:type IV secretion system protein VirB2